mgnify:CR=1 FL=1
MGFSVDINAVEQFLKEDITIQKISDLSGVAYSTVKDLRNGITALEKSSFSTLFKLNVAYDQYMQGKSPRKLSKEEKQNTLNEALNMLKMDGIQVTEETLKQFNKYIQGIITEVELSEYFKSVHSEKKVKS